ncbi:Endoribonuclease L-PSP/chorismate mutase-like protein [Corynascus novoguineensis]|uniref:Endoribonuclease L-PSP/chorismate mutase-like protein n=1 Tax=Corynascus novoguineensis TaxID=1126955 RepID=A0AAN7HSL1_9PEZI|nr:Endoribonuclease L-PSP/chorismate mutase-like protein [Corynascus novoguineensis]
MAPPVAVLTGEAPKPLPQLSQAVKYNGMVYCSGSLGIDPKTSKFVDGSVKDRTRQALKNLSAVLEAAGSSLQNVIKVNVFLTDMTNFAAMNEVYDEFFVWQPKPCRTCVAVHQLPFNSDVEIECTAFETVRARL